MFGEEFSELHDAEELRGNLTQSFQARKNILLKSLGRPPW